MLNKTEEHSAYCIDFQPTSEQTDTVLIISADRALHTGISNIYSKDLKPMVLSAYSLGEARDQLKNNQFGCCFVDGFLADDGAMNFLREFYDAEFGLSVCPVIMLAGQENESAMIEALHFGAQDYILKENLSSTTVRLAVTKAKEIFDLKKSHYHAEQQLQQTRRMEAIGQLTSGVAHDFNNLLTVVLGNTRLLRRRIEKNPEAFSLEEADKKIQSIESAASKGADLIRRMMVFSRQSALSEEITDLNVSISEIFELLKRTLGEAIVIDIIAAEKLWPVMIDAREFENAIINLAVNARDAMPRGGKLTIETSNVVLDEAYTLRHPDVPSGPYVLVSIADTGAGIERDNIKRIFEPFFTTKETGRGTGLGLSMVYGFIQQSKGHVHVYSEPGHGTVFRIYLPRTAVKEAIEQKPGSHEPEGRETILIAEDDEEVRLLVSSMLEKLGYRTLQAVNGRIALEILKKEHKSIDLVFTDIVMPGGMNGIELVQRMREYYPDVKVLYTSGYTEHSIPDYQLSVGEELISKPYRRESLAIKVRKVLDAGKAP